MTELTEDAAPQAIAMPEELDTEALDMATGGWGKTTYHSYSNDQSARYTSQSGEAQTTAGAFKAVDGLSAKIESEM